MLGASWLICGWVLARLAVPALLMAAELALTVFVAGGSVAGHFSAYRDPAPLLGLAGQVTFAAFPLPRAWPRR